MLPILRIFFLLSYKVGEVLLKQEVHRQTSHWFVLRTISSERYLMHRDFPSYRRNVGLSKFKSQKLLSRNQKDHVHSKVSKKLVAPDYELIEVKVWRIHVHYGVSREQSSEEICIFVCIKVRLKDTTVYKREVGCTKA
jgi:hypothetical protein